MGRAGSPFSGRKFVYSKSWHAAIISGGPLRVIQHWESFEVLRDGKRKKFFFDTSAYRRGISGRIFIELINGPFLYEHKGNPAEYGAGLKLAIDRGWPWRGRLPP